MGKANLVSVLLFVVFLTGTSFAQALAPAPSRPERPTLPGRAWTDQKLGSQENGDWGLAVATPAGQYIDTWRMGIGEITGTFGSSPIDFYGTVSVQGRTNTGTWLPKLNGTQTVLEYSTVNQTRGYTALYGRGGGWMTGLLGATSQDGDDIWSLNGANVGFNNTAKVVGYQLRTFGYIGDASFAFDSTI